MAEPGQIVTAVVVFPLAGNFSVVCTVPGHESAGMTGTLQVGDTPAAAAMSVQGVQAAEPTGVTLAPLPPDTLRVPQGQIASPITRREPALVKVDLAIKEVVGQLANGVGFRYWTFGGSVPGPMIRVRQGDTVELTLTNPSDMPVPHSINVHAAIGPGGGAFQISPGNKTRFDSKPSTRVCGCTTA